MIIIEKQLLENKEVILKTKKIKSFVNSSLDPNHLNENSKISELKTC